MFKYVIIDSSEVSIVDIDQIPSTDEKYFRYSLDGTKICIKYETPIPSFFSGKTTYTLEQITPVMQNSEWSEVVTAEDLGV